MKSDNAIFKVVNKLTECRVILDDVMYHSEEIPMDSEEFKKLRKIYDAICGVIDLT